eukprot:750942-Hanusia_phi.AAC.7
MSHPPHQLGIRSLRTSRLPGSNETSREGVGGGVLLTKRRTMATPKTKERVEKTENTGGLGDGKE